MEQEIHALAKDCAQIALEKKAFNIVILNITSSIADYFVLMSATSEPHVRTISEHLERTLRKKGKRAKTEGFGEARWAILDFGDVMVHIFQEDIRDFYDLERLWKDAPRELVKEAAC